MLGPSFSPSIARIPGPTSSHSRCQRLRCLRAWWTRERSRERARSSSVSGGGASRGRAACFRRGSSPPCFIGTAPAAARPARRLRRASRLASCAADGVLAARRRRTNSGPPNGWRSRTVEAVARGDAALGEVAQHLRVGVRDAHEERPRRRAAGSPCGRVRALLELELGARDRVAVGVDRGVAELGRDQLPRGPRRARARAPRPRRALGPRASPARRRESSRAAGGGG